MNGSPSSLARFDTPVGEESPSSPGAGNLAPLPQVRRGHFLFTEVRPTTFGFNPRQIFIYLRCWLLIRQIGFRVWWRR